LLSAIVIWFIYKKVKKGIGYTVKKGAEIANDQQQKWTEKEQRKKLPDILQKGFNDYDKIYTTTISLPEEWRLSIMPIVTKSKEILDEVALEFEGFDEKAKPKEQNKKLNSIRSFFIHSLDALLQFVEKLSSDHQKMSADEIDKARQNINVFKADLLSHQETLHKVRRFDFDVVMDVIKARLK
jgi:hypothetical protein